MRGVHSAVGIDLGKSITEPEPRAYSAGRASPATVAAVIGILIVLGTITAYLTRRTK
jgi:hypothetical protein